MSKVLSSSAALGALAMLCVPSAAFAQSGVSIYGIWDVSAEYLGFSSVPSHASSHIRALTSDTSRIGFRGSEDLGGGLRAYFKLENGFQADTGTQTNAAAFWSRESYVGLGSTTYGSLQFGSQFTPGNIVSLKVDPYNRFGLGGQYTLLQGVRGYQNRYDNVIQYVSPTITSVTARLYAAAGEGAATGASYSASLEYANESLYVASIYDQVKQTAASVGISGGPVISRTVSLAATYKLQVVKLHGWYQTNRINGLDKVNGYMAGFTVPLGASDLRGSYSHRSQTNADASLMSVGVIYNLSKRTALYGTVGRLLNSGVAAFRMGPATVEQAAVSLPYPGQDINGAQLGIRHFF